MLRLLWSGTGFRSRKAYPSYMYDGVGGAGEDAKRDSAMLDASNELHHNYDNSSNSGEQDDDDDNNNNNGSGRDGGSSSEDTIDSNGKHTTPIIVIPHSSSSSSDTNTNSNTTNTGGTTTIATSQIINSTNPINASSIIAATTTATTSAGNVIASTLSSIKKKGKNNKNKSSRLSFSKQIRIRTANSTKYCKNFCRRICGNGKNCRQLTQSSIGLSSVVWYSYHLFSEIIPKMPKHQWSSVKKSMFCKMFTILFLQSIEILITYPIKYLSNSIMSKDANAFYYWSVVVSSMAIIAFPVVVFDNASHALFYIQSREAVTKVLVEMYYDKQAFYYLNHIMNDKSNIDEQSNPIIDNCGQRLCIDINELCWGLNELLSILMNASAQLLGWSVILYHMQILSIGVVYLMIFGMIFVNMWLFASGMSWHTYRAFTHEYDFIAHILRTGEYSDCVALAHAQEFEQHISFNRMSHIFRAYKNVAVYHVSMKTLLHLMKYVFILIPFFLLWRAFMGGEVSFGSITQVQLAFVQLIAVVTELCGQMLRIVQIGNSSKRVYELFLALKNSHDQGNLDTLVDHVYSKPHNKEEEGKRRGEGEDEEDEKREENEKDETKVLIKNSWTKDNRLVNHGITYHDKSNTNGNGIDSQSSEILKKTSTLLMKLENVSISFPNTGYGQNGKNTDGENQFKLLRSLYLDVHEKENILIVGESGAGKSTLMKTIAGLWKYSFGDIYNYVKTNSNNNINKYSELQGGVMFLTQKPYLPLVFGETTTGDSREANSGTSKNGIGIIHSLKQQLLFPDFYNPNHHNSPYASNHTHNRYTKNDKYHYCTMDDKSAILMNLQNLWWCGNNNRHQYNNMNTSKLKNAWIDDEQLYKIMEQINLVHLLPPFLRTPHNTSLPYEQSTIENMQLCDWSKVLSMGEQQRLAIGRILWHKPRLVFLDESTSALDIWNENKMYEQISKSNITFVSIGHRQSLLQYHHRVLHIMGDGKWELISRQEYIDKYISVLQ